MEAQGEKIRDLESSLEEHRQKLASTEEMLQQVTPTLETCHIWQLFVCVQKDLYLHLHNNILSDCINWAKINVTPTFINNELTNYWQFNSNCSVSSFHWCNCFAHTFDHSQPSLNNATTEYVPVNLSSVPTSQQSLCLLHCQQSKTPQLNKYPTEECLLSVFSKICNPHI